MIRAAAFLWEKCKNRSCVRGEFFLLTARDAYLLCTFLDLEPRPSLLDSIG